MQNRRSPAAGTSGPRRTRRRAGVGLMVALVGVPRVLAAADGHRTASFIPHWLPQAQFAGYYVAADAGIYGRHGLDVTIVMGGPDRPASEALAARTTDFATMWLSTAVQLRARGVPVVNVAQIMQRSALMLLAKTSSGITSPHDMDGKKVGVWGGDFLVQPLALFKQLGVTPTIVPLGATINLFLRDGVQVTTAMWYNEYHTILNTGLDPDELRPFFFHEYGLNFPEDGVYCLEDTLARDPDLVRAFVAASLDGWQHAFAHPDATVDLMVRTKSAAHLGANVVHQRWMLNRMRDLIQPDANGRPSGRLDPADYARVGRVLVENGMLPEVPPYDAIYRPVLP